MTIYHSKVKNINGLQTIPLPKETMFSEPVRNVDLVAEGNARIVSPCAQSWKEWFSSAGCSDDFMTSRE